jgi:hypothetical protein
MEHLLLQLRKADRLHAITQKVGFALWQLQELEGMSAQYFVLIVQASPGMGLTAGQALLDKALSKTFGGTVTQLVKARRLSKQLEARFQALLAERNWLVHSSRSTSRDAIHSAQACQALIHRLDKIAGEASALIKEIGKEAEIFVKKYGVAAEQVQKQTAETLRRWHAEDAL